MDTYLWLSLEFVRCPQFDTVSRTLSMNEERKNGLNSALSVYSIGSQRNLVPVKARAAYFKKRKKVAVIVIVLALLVASLIACVIMLAVLYSRLKQAPAICDTEDCLRAAANLKSAMDTSIDPCDDFYGYACGRWSEEHFTSAGESLFDDRADRVTRKIRDFLQKNLTENEVPWAVLQAKKLHESCIDIESLDHLGLEPLLRLLQELGLPQTPAGLSEKRGNFIQQMAKVRRILAKDVFIGIDIGPNPQNRSQFIIYVDSPTTRSPLPSYNREVEKKLKYIRLHSEKLEDEHEDDLNDGDPEKMYMIGVIEELATNGNVTNCSIKDEAETLRNREMKKVVDAIYKLLGILHHMSGLDDDESLNDEDLNDENYILVDVLQEITDRHVQETNSSLIPRKLWRPYMEEVLRDVEDVDLSKVKILVSNIEYMKNVAYLLETTDEVVLEAAIWWMVVEVAVPHSSKKLRSLWQDYITEFIGAESNEPRSLYCAELVKDMMAMAISWLYVDPNFHTGKGVKVAEMLDDIRSAFASLVTKADWMDRTTQLATLEKSRKMTYAIGHPDWLFEKGKIDEYYEGIDMKEDTFLENMLTMLRLESQAELELLEEINFMNETIWAVEPIVVNAMHTFMYNHITVPAGMLQFPFYDLGLEALNYGAIGTILGHELTHGFDNRGRLYDGDGNLRQWWSNATINQYNDKIECFVKHYSSYYIEEIDRHIDGWLTLGENIADNGGLREAILAYKRWKAKHGQEPMLPGFTHLTHEQLLFLGFAQIWCEFDTADSLRWMVRDPHCPGFVRLKGVLRNSQEFSDTWQCPLGSEMNPVNKCQIW